MPIGLTLPLARSTGSVGYVATSSTELEASYYNLKALLLTDWGERPNNYYMGCNLTEFLFQPSNQETQVLIEERIRNQVGKWLPYIVLEEIDTDFPADHKLSVRVTFSLRGSPENQQTVDVTVPVRG